MVRIWMTSLCFFVLASLADSLAGETAAELVVVDANGKDIKAKTWKFLSGTRHLSWLDKGPVDKKGDKTPRGPECLELREDRSTTLQDGILTLVPLTSVKKIDFDNDKKTIAVTVLTAGDKEEGLAGSTKYVGINKLNLEVDADLGALGSGTLKFQGGIAKGGIRGLRFAAAKTVAPVTGPAATITARDKEKTVHKVHDLVPLYRTGVNLAIHPQLMFKKTVRINLAGIQKLRHIEAEDKKQVSNDFEILLEDGKQLTLTLLRDAPLEEGKSSTLLGLIGRVPAGYKLFPLHTIDELRMDDKTAPDTKK
jgi:hypothetical protein